MDSLVRTPRHSRSGRRSSSSAPSEEAGELESSADSYPLTPYGSPISGSQTVGGMPLLPSGQQSPLMQTICLLVALVPEGVLEAMLIPLYPYMVRSTGTIPESEVGYYSGLLSSAFYGPLLVMNVVWGGVSDRIGRKKVLVLGCAVGLIASVILVFGKAYWMFLSARVLAGLCGANSTVTKGLLGEVWKDESGRAWGFAMYGVVYGAAGIIGPMLAGLLADPVTRLGWGGWWIGRPFALACMVGTGLMVCGLALVMFCVEDQPARRGILKKTSTRTYEPLEDHDSAEFIAETVGSPRGSSSSMRAVEEPIEDDCQSSSSTGDTGMMGFILPISLYCVTAFTNAAYLTSVPLFLSAPEPDGLNKTPSETSLNITIIASTKLLSQLFLFTIIVRYIGKWGCVGGGLVGYALGNALLAILVIWVGAIPLPLIMVILGYSEVLAYCAVIMLINDTAPPGRLGLTHGLAGTCAAAVRTMAPAVAGSVWQWSVHLGGSARMSAFLLNTVLCLVGVVGAVIGHRRHIGT
ncbi:hypothetical protein HDU85_002801 [Gaertneriomyces sp. JEL0708]|nr:hypothetical protein HDU85_002801 [Gaertneriomyces sp. JEL0708]